MGVGDARKKFFATLPDSTALPPMQVLVLDLNFAVSYYFPTTKVVTCRSKRGRLRHQG